MQPNQPPQDQNNVPSVPSHEPLIAPRPYLSEYPAQTQPVQPSQYQPPVSNQQQDALLPRVVDQPLEPPLASPAEPLTYPKIQTVTPLTPSLIESTTAPDPLLTTVAADQPLPSEPASRLITEPLKPYAQQDILQTNSMTAKKSHVIRNRILSVVFGLVVILVAASTAMSLLIGRVSESDLVEAKTQNTSYLYPKQWKSLGGLSGSGYGDSLGKNGKSSSLMVVSLSKQQVPGLFDMPKSSHDMLRKQTLNTLTDATIESSFAKGDNGCQQINNIQKEEDTQSSSTTLGIYKLTINCHRDNANFTIKVRGFLGKDGYIRTVMIGADKIMWDKNDKVYQKMFDSVHQTDSPV